MTVNRFFVRLLLIAAIFFLTSLPPLAHHAYAEDNSDSASGTDDDHSAMDDGDKDDDKQADKDDDNSDKESADKEDRDDDHPKPARYYADKPSPSRAPAETPALKAEEEPVPSPTGNWWHPHPGIKWQIQYVGTIDPATRVEAFDLDLFDTDAATIQALHAHGTKAICYFSAGSYEGWRPDIKRFPAAVLGRALEGWKYERWLDIRKLDVLKPIMEDRIRLARQKGCDAIDPDNVEGYDNKTGFALSPVNQVAYNKMIANLAHSMGMAVGLKNDLDQVEELLPYFDFQVNEQCFEYHGCKDLIPFIKANKPVFNIEYNVAPEKFCPQANAMNFDSLKKDLDLGLKVKSCR